MERKRRKKFGFYPTPSSLTQRVNEFIEFASYELHYNGAVGRVTAQRHNAQVDKTWHITEGNAIGSTRIVKIYNLPINCGMV